jgi:uncharacterized membrane protein YccC
MLPAAPVLGAHVRKSLELAGARPAFALGLRAATATIGPLVIGEITGNLLFVWMALGGWLCAIVDPGGPHVVRARSMAAFAVTGSLVTGLGALASDSPAVGIALLFVVSIASSLARVGGDAAGAVGTATLIQLCIALGSPAPVSQTAPRVAMVLAGCVLSAFLALVLWPVHAYRPARVSLGSCYRLLASLARSLAGLSGDREHAWSALVVQQPPRVRAQLESARVALGAVRRGRFADSARSQQLVILFETADVLLATLIMAGEALATEHRAEASWLRQAAEVLEGIGKAIEEDAEPPPMPAIDAVAAEDPELEQARTRVVGALELAIRLTAALHSGEPHGDELAPTEAEVPRTTLRAALAPDSTVLRHALRMAVTVCIGAAIAATVGIVKASWITIAIVIVLQPDSGSTVRRAVHRVGGTIVGAGAAAVIAPALHSPTLIGFVLFPLSALGLALRPVNYGLFTLLVTPVFLLMAEIASGDWHLGRARVVNTLIGGGLALGAQLLWPSRERDELPRRLEALFQRLREYLDRVLADPRSEPQARRSFGLAAANADASFQRHLGEVLEPPERVSTYLTLLTYARRFRNAIVMALDSSEAGALRAARPVLDETLQDFAAAVREGRAPAAIPDVPEAGAAMQRIARQLGVLQSSVERLASNRIGSSS